MRREATGCVDRGVATTASDAIGRRRASPAAVDAAVQPASDTERRRATAATGDRQLDARRDRSTRHDVEQPRARARTDADDAEPRQVAHVVARRQHDHAIGGDERQHRITIELRLAARPSHQVASPSSTLVFHTQPSRRPPRSSARPRSTQSPAAVSSPASRRAATAHLGVGGARRRRRGRGGVDDRRDGPTGGPLPGSARRRRRVTAPAVASRRPCRRYPQPCADERRRPTVEPFQKLSIFFPMWNEEDYIERAVDAGQRGLRGAGRARRDRRLRADHRRRRVDRPHARDRRRAGRRRPARPGRPPRAQPQARRRDQDRLRRRPRGDLVLYTDADLPFDMAELPRAVRLLRDYEADIVSAYRFDRTGEGYAAGGLHVRLQPADPARCSASGCATSTSPSSSAGAGSSTTSSCASEGSFIDAELVIRAHAARATRSCSSASTTSRAPAACRR